MKVNIKLPRLLVVDDYHEFGPAVDIVNSMTDAKLKFSEIGRFNGGDYIAVVYVGRKPNKATIAKLLQDVCYDAEPEL